MIIAKTVKAGPKLVWPERVVRDITILTLPNIKSHDHILFSDFKNVCRSSYPTFVYCLVIISSLGSRCLPWLGEGLSMSSPNDPAVLCHIVSLQYLSRWSLHRLAGLPCRIFLTYGLQVVTREVHRSSLRWLICPAQDHFIILTV